MGEGYESADDWAALFAACVIAFNGIRLFRSALREVLDVSAPPELLSNVRDVARDVPGVIDVEKCRVRASGLVYFIDLHVIVDGGLTTGGNVARVWAKSEVAGEAEPKVASF